MEPHIPTVDELSTADLERVLEALKNWEGENPS